MEVLVELILELVAQLFVEGALDGAGQRTGKSLRSPRARRRLGYAVSLVLALLAGSAWGILVARRGREALPRSVWVSVALASICVLMAVIARLRGVPVGDSLGGWRAFRRPDRWPAIRWLSFAVMSAVIAVAIVIGFLAAQPG